MEAPPLVFTSLGTILIDHFEWLNENGKPSAPSIVQLGGSTLFAAAGSRIWLRPNQIVVPLLSDDGLDGAYQNLSKYGSSMWVSVEGGKTI